MAVEHEEEFVAGRVVEGAMFFILRPLHTDGFGVGRQPASDLRRRFSGSGRQEHTVIMRYPLGDLRE